MVRNAVYSFIYPENQSKGAFLLSWNKDMAERMGVDTAKLERSQWSDEEYDNVVKVLTGGATRLAATEGGDTNARLAEPWALCYGGHQFGFYAGQLGDGRAISLCMPLFSVEHVSHHITMMVTTTTHYTFITSTAL
jgi:hypothetical protein